MEDGRACREQLNSPILARHNSIEIMMTAERAIGIDYKN